MTERLGCRRFAVIFSFVVGLLSAPELSSAQPAPTPPPPAARRAPDPSRQAAGPTIEGAYTIEGSTAKVQVRRLRGDFYFLESTEWEGVGFLQGAIYPGVFRHRGSPDVPDVAIGEHTIDWTALERPSVQATYSSPSARQLAQHWSRVPDSVRTVTVQQPPVVVAPVPAGATAQGQRPAFGEYVYVEELPEAITKVRPADIAGVEGTVLVQALVLEDGSVGDAKVVKSVPGLDEAAVAAVRQWRFKPAMAKGRPVSVWVAVPIKFPAR